MPAQQQNSSFAKKLGGRVAQANAEHKDKPVDTGNRRLPGGIRNGIAKLSAMYTKEYEDGDNKGQTFFRASAIVVGHRLPDGSVSEVFNGEKISGAVTQQIISLCDVEAKGNRKAKSFNENWYEFQNIFKILGVQAPNYNSQTDPDGTKTEGYYLAAMKMLVEKKPPVYVAFSTTSWTSKAPVPPGSPPREPMVFENWHGIAQYDAQHNPAAGFNQAPPTQTQAAMGAAPPPTTGAPPQYQPGGEPDPADVVAALVESAMNDPNGATPDGQVAGAKLEEMAWTQGWTKEQTGAAADWAAVGDMALNPPSVAQDSPGGNPTGSTPTATAAATPGISPPTPGIGSKWKMHKRDKAGLDKLKNRDGVVFPPSEVEVTAINGDNSCHVKFIKDGKDYLDIRSKKPVPVKFEWLEPIAY